MSKTSTEQSIEYPIAYHDNPEEGEYSIEVPYNPKEHNHRRKLILICVAVVVLIAIAGTITGLLVSGGGEKETSAVEETGTPNTSGTAEPPVSAPVSNPTSSDLPPENTNAGPITDPDKLAISELIRANSPVGEEVFDDPNSYQYKVLDWMLSQSTSLDDVSEQHQLQRYALGCIYEATNAVYTPYTNFTYGSTTPGWRKQTQWMSNTDFCEGWFGIECWTEDDDDLFDANLVGFVKKIELHENRVTGSLPIETILLKDSLQTLDLFDNIIWNKGPEQNDWLGELTNLKELFFQLTYFDYDGIPTSFGKLTKLEELDCSYTLYHGELVEESFEGLSNLKYLVMGGNEYKSTIPEAIFDLTNLQYLYMDNADLTGSLDGIEKLKKLRGAWFQRNPELSATIPTAVGTLSTSLTALALAFCDIQGTIPTEIGDLQLLKYLGLQGNSLTGSVPSEIGQILELEILELYENERLTGFVPQSVCNLVEPVGLVKKLTGDCETGLLECSCCTKCY